MKTCAHHVIFSAAACSLLIIAAVAQDKLILPDAAAPPGESILLPMSIAGTSPVVAMQFDVRFTKEVVDVLGPIAAGDSNHRVMSREMSDGLRRVVVFSRSNAVLPKDVIIDLPMVMASGNGSTVAPVLRIQGVSFALEDGTQVTPVIQRGPIDEWLLGHFSAADLQVPSIYGDNADIDTDGLPNLVEYALGGSPFTFDGPLVPVVGIVNNAGGEGLLKLTWHKSRSASGVVIEPQFSENLVQWTPLAASPTGVEDAASIEFSASLDRNAKAKAFLRLNVRRQE